MLPLLSKTGSVTTIVPSSPIVIVTKVDWVECPPQFVSTVTSDARQETPTIKSIVS